jgi:leucyl-tRNA synthetase
MASDWKWTVYMKALEMAESGKLDRSVLIREVMSDPLMKTKGKEIALFAGRIAGQGQRMPDDQRKLRIQLKKLDEMDVLKSAQKLYSKQFDVAVFVFREDDSELYDPKGRAALAQPYRPAIYIE